MGEYRHRRTAPQFLLAVGLSIAFGALICVDARIAAACMLGVPVFLAVDFLSQRMGWLSVGIYAATGILLCGLIFPLPIRFTAELFLLSLALFFALGSLFNRGSLGFPSLFFLLLVLLYCLATLNSNVPDLATGLQGARRVLVALSALVLGLAVGQREWRGWGTHVAVLTTLMTGSAVASLILHLVFPEIETSFSRAAGIYTALLGGETRMQGLLSGPFHIGMLGSFLVLWGFAKGLNARKGGMALIMIGAALLTLSKVRTAVLATVLGLAILGFYFRPKGKDIGLAGPQATKHPLRLVLLALLSIALFIFIFRESTLLEKLTEIGTDQRSGHRWNSILEAFELFTTSPLLGWGAGSTATGLSGSFLDLGLVHVTVHNGALGLLVELGFIGLFCFLAIWIALIYQWRRMRSGKPSREKDSLLIAAFVPLFVFWCLGDALAALPVSYCLCFLMGLTVATYQEGSDGDGIVPSPSKRSAGASGLPAQQGTSPL